MTRRVVITGAAGNVGAKLRAHLEAQGGYDLRLIDRDPRGDATIKQADLSIPDRAWSDLLAGADAVVHLAAQADSQAGWHTLTPANVDGLLNLYLAAAAHRVPRIVLTSSVWAVAARREDDGPIGAQAPDPGLNRYGATKLFAERTALAFWRSHGIEAVVLRLGGCRPGENPPTPAYDPWEDSCWTSNRDACDGLERALTAPVSGVAVLNLVSGNPGGRWSLEETREVLGYEPQDGYAPPPPPAPPSRLTRLKRWIRA